jgi:hypothetical protein
MASSVLGSREERRPAAAPSGFSRFHRQFWDRVARPCTTEGRIINGTLLSHTLDVKDGTVRRRRASISVDGTPVVYSLQVPELPNSPSFRILCEPGGLGISVADQVEFARAVVRKLTDELGWREAQIAADELLARVLPADRTTMSDWLGGIWIGSALRADASELRVYANLRNGEPIARWQRVADLLAPFADQRLIPVVREWMGNASKVAIPVGVGMVLNSVGMPIIRVYLGVEYPGVAAIRIARGDQLGEADSRVAEFCGSFTAAYGAFRRQSMTLGYDFVRDSDGLLRPEISRFKADVSFGHLGGSEFPSPNAFIAEQMDRAFPGEAASWSTFCGALTECFGGHSIEYLSLSMRSGNLSHMTGYARPNGYRAN